MHLDLRREVLKSPWFRVGLSSAALLSLAALVGPLLTPYEAHDMAFTPLAPPSGKHPLGVNDGGMDILTELLCSLRNTASFGILTALAALFIGGLIGMVSAWFGGWVDHVLMRVADILLAIPSIMILILTAALFRPAPGVLILILATMSWPTTAKAFRAQTFVLKKGLHVQAAKQMGATGFYILTRHFIPEFYPLYLIGFAAKARMAMLMEASLAFLGLFDPARKSLGVMISYALKYYYLDMWWNWLLPPIVCLSLLMMSVTFLAVSLEKVLDPRLREAL